MMDLRSNDCFVTGAPCLNRGHGYDFASSVGHLRLELVRLLVYDSMRTYPGHQCCIIGLSRQRQLGVKMRIRMRLLAISASAYAKCGYHF